MYKRPRAPEWPQLVSGTALDHALRGIGLRLHRIGEGEGDPASAEAALRGAEWTGERRAPDIELTLLSATVEALRERDGRLLSLVVAWLSVHAAQLHVERLVRAVTAWSVGATQTEDRALISSVLAFWAGVGGWLSKDRRFARLRALYCGPAVTAPLPAVELRLARSGEDPRFAGGPFRTPSGFLRDRAADVEPPAWLAAWHSGYRARVMLGPTWRADLWAALTEEPGLTASALARRVGASFAAAWRVKHDYGLWSGASA